MSDWMSPHKIKNWTPSRRGQADMRIGSHTTVAGPVTIYKVDPETGERVVVGTKEPYTHAQLNQMFSDASNPRNSRRTGKNKRLGEKGK